MKKVVILSIVFACFTLMGIDSAVAQDKASIFLQFGRKSQGCNGIGICKLHAEIYGLSIDYNMGKVAASGLPKGSLSIDENANTCTFTFSDSEVQQKASDKVAEFQSGSKFYVDEDIPLSREFLAALKLTRTTAILKAGTYDIQHKNGVYTITIPLK
jgi:hypothetical protein